LADHESLARSGLSEAEIVEIVAAIGFGIYSAVLAKTLRIPVDEPFQRMLTADRA
jgi:alkylhydroperoxidase family enzyme